MEAKTDDAVPKKKQKPRTTPEKNAPSKGGGGKSKKAEVEVKAGEAEKTDGKKKAKKGAEGKSKNKKSSKNKAKGSESQVKTKKTTSKKKKKNATKKKRAGGAGAKAVEEEGWKDEEKAKEVADKGEDAAHVEPMKRPAAAKGSSKKVKTEDLKGHHIEGCWVCGLVFCCCGFMVAVLLLLNITFSFPVFLVAARLLEPILAELK